MKKTIIHIVTVTFLFASTSCGTPVSEYEPKNQAEQEIKALLIEFLDCRNKHDLDGLLALFRDDAKIMQYKLQDRMNPKYATKKESRETWPELFKSNPTVKFTNPKMEVTENKAVVNFKISTDGVKLKGTQHLIKENDRWLVIKFTYESGAVSPR
jgi:ketosteroid isomerase-like protein